MSHRAVCFVMMPYGKKRYAPKLFIDFEHIYSEIIAPAVADAGLDCVRADKEHGAGFVHKLMYERLVISEYAIADLTLPNANVYYELGVRHASRQESTVLIKAEESPLPFDLVPVRALLLYKLDKSGLPVDAAKSCAELTRRLKDTYEHRTKDSPLFQLLEGYLPPPIDRLKTDVFRTNIGHADWKARFHEAERGGVDALDKIRNDLGALRVVEESIAVNLFLSYRAISAWERVIDVCANLDKVVQRTPLVREQWALALNRVGRDREAETILIELIAERGPSSESNALLGRIYKDRWSKALDSGDRAANGHLPQAIKAYREGFEADWRDAYPGINAVTLTTIHDPTDPSAKEMAGVVKYAVRRRLAGKKPDYWDHATLLELAVIESDPRGASQALDHALAALAEGWMAKSTATNLRMIADAREAANIDTNELREIIAELDKAAARVEPAAKLRRADRPAGRKAKLRAALTSPPD
jgi:hypothetical protein